MRGAACAAVVCSLLLVAACDSGRELSISHPRLLKGEVEAANVAGLRASMPAHVDFVSNRDGFVATEGGTILATGDSGRTWARHGSVPHQASISIHAGSGAQNVSSRSGRPAAMIF